MRKLLQYFRMPFNGMYYVWIRARIWHTGCPYRASVRLNQKGGIYFCARRAYRDGDVVVFEGLVRSLTRVPVVPQRPVGELAGDSRTLDEITSQPIPDYGLREETSRREPVYNLDLSTCVGFASGPEERPSRSSMLPGPQVLAKA